MCFNSYNVYLKKYIKMKAIIFFLLLFPSIPISAQLKNSKEKQQVSHEIKQNALRLSLNVPIIISQDPIYLGLNFEHRLGKSSFSLISTASVATYTSFLGKGSLGSKNKWSYHGFFAGELKYYYNLRRRERLNKNTKNFTAGYLSLQPYVLTNPFLLVNEVSKNASGHTGAFLNIGYQWQTSNIYVGTFFGVRLLGNYFVENSYITRIQAGIVIGGFLN